MFLDDIQPSNVALALALMATGLQVILHFTWIEVLPWTLAIA